eukprot:CCRYP_006634-RA/>CCRYP_006634-RA protein AED:0.45 eAED:0.45 QI:0/-1/0/1/-1/1/1/0/82
MYAPRFMRASKWGLTRTSLKPRRLLSQPRKKKKGNKGDVPGMTTEAASPALVEAKAIYDKVLKALEDAKLAVSMAGAKPFEL